MKTVTCLQRSRHQKDAYVAAKVQEHGKRQYYSEKPIASILSLKTLKSALKRTAPKAECIVKLARIHFLHSHHWHPQLLLKRQEQISFETNGATIRIHSETGKNTFLAQSSLTTSVAVEKTGTSKSRQFLGMDYAVNSPHRQLV